LANAEAAPAEAEFKAAVIYNFARFASWPVSRFPDARAPVVLCVSPSDPLADALERLEGQPVGTRRLHVRTTTVFGPECQAAFVSGPANSEVAALQRDGVLTIGEAPDFARRGAIGLVKVGRQIRFEINPSAADQAGVKLSSQLLRLAMAIRR
jgi:hypothetical protein